MKKLVLFKLFLILFFLNSCTTVQTKIDQKIEVEPPDNNSGKSDSIPEQPNELPTEDAPLLNF